MARDYELEAALAAVEGRVAEPIVRALIVGPAGSQEGTLGGALKAMLGRGRRASGLTARDVLVLTDSSIRLFTCRAHGWPPIADREVGTWPRGALRVATEAAEKTSAFSSTNSGSETNRYYRITLTPGDDEPVVLECPRSDSARTTIQALEDATGSPPSKVTARRRKRHAASADDPEPPAKGGA